ncbi:MAG TPA: SIS domain-containing protein [Candidatus Thermoplasmatota archaeon]|nr:SIS domain-containing protein [Candidatus Thermoplasmatota archaeon]
MLASLNPAFLKQVQGKAGLVETGFRAGLEAAVPDLKAKGLLFAGMGGSGATAMLVRDAAARVLDVPFTLVQHYNVPNHVKADWHALGVSYSGRTEETLSAMREAQRRGCRTTAFCTGGAIAEMAERNVPQPTGYQPRVALAHSWFSVLGFLEGSGLLGERVPAREAAAAIRAVDASCGPEVPEAHNEARQLARRLADRIPQVYTTPAFSGLGLFFASLLNENAKKICEVDELPESNHNAFTGWSGDPFRAHFTALVLSHGAQNPELARRIAFMRQRYEAWGVPWHHREFGPIHSFADHVVEQARALALLDYASYYTAELRGVDPAQIDEVLGLKAHLRQAGAGAPAPDVQPQYLV